MTNKNVEIITPKDREEWLSLRQADVTSTEISALFNLSPYITHYELWHRKKNNTAADFQENTRTIWGTRLEDSIAQGIAKDQNFKVRKMSEYIREPELRMGSSFDYSIEACLGHEGEGILEIKNVDGLQFKNAWLKDEQGNLEAPAHIELQIQHQMLVSGRAYAYIGALIGGNEVKLIERKADQEIQFSIVEAVRGFWESVERGTAPEPDFQRDASFISKLYGYAEPGKHLDSTGNGELRSLVEQYKAAGAQAKEYEEAKQAIKAQILMMIGDAEKIKSDEGYSISAGLIGPSSYTVERKGYRDFRVFTKKVKE